MIITSGSRNELDTSIGQLSLFKVNDKMYYANKYILNNLFYHKQIPNVSSRQINYNVYLME